MDIPFFFNHCGGRPHGHGHHDGRHGAWETHGEHQHPHRRHGVSPGEPGDDRRGGRGGRGGRDGFGPFGGRSGGGPRGGGPGGPGARPLGHGDLKLLLLALIEQQPRHGYELIRTIAEMFGGHYTPSPGSIYPTLTLLEELGLLSSEAGARKQYAIAEAGVAFLAENREAVDAVMARTEHSARMVAKAAAPMAVRTAMHNLKHALMSRRADWDAAEAERITAILARATAEIEQVRT